PGRTLCAMTMRRLIVIGMTLLVIPSAARNLLSQQPTAIRFARLVDGKGGVINDGVVVVQGERITSVGAGAKEIPAGATVIDLRPLTGIPGLIDRGAMVGPRMLVAGFGLSRQRTPPRPGAPPGLPRGRISEMADIPVAVKAQVDAGADWIKMYGSTGSAADVTGDETFTFDE